MRNKTHYRLSAYGHRPLKRQKQPTAFADGFNLALLFIFGIIIYITASTF